jgi:hypothetical protein
LLWRWCGGWQDLGEAEQVGQLEAAGVAAGRVGVQPAPSSLVSTSTPRIIKALGSAVGAGYG